MRNISARSITTSWMESSPRLSLLSSSELLKSSLVGSTWSRRESIIPCSSRYALNEVPSESPLLARLKSPQRSAIAIAAAFLAAARARNVSRSVMLFLLVSTAVPTNATMTDIIRMAIGMTAKRAVPRFDGATEGRERSWRRVMVSRLAWRCRMPRHSAASPSSASAFPTLWPRGPTSMIETRVGGNRSDVRLTAGPSALAAWKRFPGSWGGPLRADFGHVFSPRLTRKCVGPSRPGA